MGDPEILGTIMVAAKQLNELGATYIHLCEADWDDAPEVPESFRKELRSGYKNTIIVTGNYTPDRAEDAWAQKPCPPYLIGSVVRYRKMR